MKLTDLVYHIEEQRQIWNSIFKKPQNIFRVKI